MFIKDYHGRGFYRNKQLFIDSVCINRSCHSAEFKEQLTKMIAYSVEPEYVAACYDAITSPDNLDRTAIDYCISKAQLSRKIRKCKANWDKFFYGWRIVSGEDYREIAKIKGRKNRQGSEGQT